MPIIRKQLKPSDVYPDNIRYDQTTDTVQSNVNGTWVDNPAADPRNQTTIPARLTSDPACDAAQSVTDAIKGQVDNVKTAIDNASTLFTIAGIILSIFTFGTFDIFVGLALAIGGDMVSAGTAAITAALTDPVWDTFKCIVYCQFDGSTGRLVSGGFAQIQSDVTDQIGGLGATILNAMVSLAGEGGINNLAAIGTSTGDCSACDCGCGTETIGLTLNIYYAGDPVATECTVEGDALTDGSLMSFSVTWDGTHPWKIIHEEIVTGAPGSPTQWQWYLADGSGPFTSSSAPIGVSVQTLEISGHGSSAFHPKWRVATP